MGTPAPPVEDPPPASDLARPRALVALLVVVALSALVYAPSLGNDFAMDDRLVAKATWDDGRPNPLIAERQPLGAYFRAHYWQGTQASGDLYRPVTVLSYARTYDAFGRDAAREARPQHALNLALHAAAVALAYGLVRAGGARRRAALLGAAAFAFHALHSEVVAAVVGRAELLAFVFGGAGALLLQRRGVAAGAAAAACLFLALASKESAAAWIPLAVVLGLARAWRADPAAPLGPALGRAAARAAAVAALPLAAWLWLRHRALSGLPDAPGVAYVVNPLHELGFAERLAPALRVWGFGLRQTLLPFDLAADYGAAVFDVGAGWESPRTWLAVLALATALALAVRGARRAPLRLLAGATFLGFSLVTANVLLPIGTIYGERLYFAPSLAVAFGVAAVAGRAWGPRARRALLGALAVWLVACAATAWQRNGVWKDDATLFLAEVANQPDSARVQTVAAGHLHARGDLDGALACALRAVELEPEYGLAWSNLASLRLEAGDPVAAEAAAARGLAAAHLGPDDEALRLLHANRGLALVRIGRGDEAGPHWAGALATFADAEERRAFAALLVQLGAPPSIAAGG